MSISRRHVAIIGAGSVGASIAYAIMLRQLPVNISLVDVNEETTEGQTLDLGDAEFLTPTTVSHATFQQAGQADIIVITAGAKQKPGESRESLVARNESIMQSILHNIQPINPNVILLIVANPVEVLTHVAQQLSGLPKSQVLGSGTFLDTMRLRKHLGDLFSIIQNRFA